MGFVILGFFILSRLVGGGSADDQTQDAAAQPSVTIAAETTAAPAPEPTTAAPPAETAPAVPTEYKSALKKAQSYIKTMNFSQARLYDQLTSEYGEKFSPEAAQYAIDNVDADWNAEALAAISYLTMAMSPSAIWDQLVSMRREIARASRLCDRKSAALRIPRVWVRVCPEASRRMPVRGGSGRQESCLAALHRSSFDGQQLWRSAVMRP